MKSETDFSREAIENERGKVLMENSITGRSCRSAELLIQLILQNYTDNANGDVPKRVTFLISSSSKCVHVILGSKTN